MHYSFIVSTALAGLASASIIEDRVNVYSATPTSSSSPTGCAALVGAGETFPAKLGYACLTSVPLNKTVAADLLNYITSLFDIHSTIPYLKNPPPSYQQPAVDVMTGLATIGKQLDNGTFKNEYDFEASIQTIIQLMHDGHVGVDGGVIGTISFQLPIKLASVSPDGKALPKLYNYEDLVTSQSDGYTASPIAKIDSRDANTWIAQFAAQYVPGYREPHSDWNNMLFSIADAVAGIGPWTQEMNLYPGDTMVVMYENGTHHELQFLATAGGVPWPASIKTGQELYEAVVVNNNPSGASASASAAASSAIVSTGVATASGSALTSVPSIYPSPTAEQPGWSIGGEAFLLGFILEEENIAVMTLPSFNMFDQEARDFVATATSFISKAQAAGCTKLVIDVMGNPGGDVAVGYEFFRLLFPSMVPYGGTRMRAGEANYAYGNSITTLFQSGNLSQDDLFNLAKSDWNAFEWINAATDETFKSWDEFYGPVEDNGDQFTVPARTNISDDVFWQSQSSDGTIRGIELTAVNGRNQSYKQPFDTSDIVLLTDGLCTSTCTLFGEMMHQIAGVKTVVIGGLPQAGPMQYLGGSRGAQSMEASFLDSMFSLLTKFNASIAKSIPPLSIELEFNLTSMEINLLDQVRANESVPLQFVYDPADCRIFWTPETFNNYTNLYSYVAKAMWTDGSYCVNGSIGQPASRPNTTDTTSGPSSTNNYTAPSGPSATSSASGSSSSSGPSSSFGSGSGASPTPSSSSDAAVLSVVGWSVGAILVAVTSFMV